MSNTAKEAVNHPAHYRGGVYEVINIIVFYKLGFCLGNVAKYILRAGAKDPDKELEDLKKARWYLDYEIATRDGTAKGPEYFIDLAAKGAELGIPKEDIPTNPFPEMQVTIDGLKEATSRRQGIAQTATEFLADAYDMGFARAGDKVRFLDDNGHDYQRMEARKYLVKDGIYEVAEADIGSSYSSYIIKGIPGYFNTVMFERVDD